MQSPWISFACTVASIVCSVMLRELQKNLCRSHTVCTYSCPQDLWQPLTALAAHWSLSSCWFPLNLNIAHTCVPQAVAQDLWQPLTALAAHWSRARDAPVRGAAGQLYRCLFVGVDSTAHRQEVLQVRPAWANFRWFWSK